ncbi:MAG: aminotransferase class III-fold pyridoxal phosphate-dependent enzyme [bacterium]
MGKGQDLYKKAKKIIPGGTQLLSKRPEMHLPDLWPAYYKKAKGCEVWDLDGKKYIDMSYMGVGACVLGYADEDVNRAVLRAVESGNVSTLNAPEEVELARKLLKLHPWAEMARFALSGGEALAITVRIARAAIGKDKVLFCGYHGWHDWYLSSNLADDKALDGHLLPGLEPKGVPRALKGTAIPFVYNDTKEFLRLVRIHEKELAAVVLEPIRNHFPKGDFLNVIRETTLRKKIVLIADEVSSGFRLCAGGAHLKLGFSPDMAVFAKAMGNGFPVAAIIGKSDVMSAAETTFISSTNWTDRLGLSAALAVIKKFKEEKVENHLERAGRMVQDAWQKLAEKHGLKVHTSGIYPISHFDFDYSKPLVYKTLYTQLMLKEGFLASTAYYASFAHKQKHLAKYIKAIDKVFAQIAHYHKAGNVEKCLKSKVCHSGFFRLT